MNHISTLTRSRWLLLTLFTLLVGVSPAWGQTTILSEDFESNSLSTNEWTTVNPGTNASAISTEAKRNGTYGYKFCYYSSSKPSNSPRYLISKQLSIPANASNINLSFFYSKYISGSEKFAVGYSTTTNEVGAFTWSGDITNAAYNSWKEYNLELNNDVKYIAIQYKSGDQYYLYIDDITITCDIVSGPGFAVKDGSTKLSSPYAYSFGLTTAGTTKTFKLTNPGNAATPISVDVTGANGFTAAVEDNATSIPAGGEKTLTITMPNATASGSVVVTPTGDGLSAFTFNVSGTVRDPNKVYLDFSDGQIPDGWTSVAIGSYASSYGTAWAASTGYISQSGGSSSYAWAFTSPKLNFTNGEKVFFETAKYSSGYSSPSITVEYTTDATGATGWTAIGSAFTDDTYGNWTSRSVTIPVEGVKRIRFNGWYVHMRNIYGGEEPNEPNMVVTQPTTLGFGLYDKDASPAPTKTFTIANTGKATLSGISVTSGNAAFEITGAPSSLAAGEDAEVTITMSTATAGALSSLITVSATDMEDASFTVTGTIKPAGMSVEEFTDGLPANWTNASWTFANGEATGKSGSAYLTTPKISFSAGDFIIIKAKRYDSDSSDYLTVQGSNDNGSTWTAYSKKLQNADGLTYPDYGTMVLTDIPATVNKLRFVGYYCVVDEIHGLNYAPVLAVTKDETPVSSPAAYDFGEQAANASVTYNFANAGAGTLSVTNVEVTNTPDDGTYTTSWTESVATPFNLVITQNYDAEKAGGKTGSVVVTMSDASTFTINLSGTLLAANAPTLAVDNTLEFGKLTANDTQTVTVTNSGTGSMTVDIVSDNALFTVSPAQLTEIGAGASKTFDVTFHYDQVTAGNYGVKNANITVTPTYNAEAAIVINASAKAKDPEEWSENFAGNAKPDGWDAGANWTFAEGKAKASYDYSATNYLTTPSLTVTGETDGVTFDYEATSNYVSILIQKSKNGGAFTDLHTISGLNNGDAGSYTITGLEAGNYKFRFKNDDYNLDNFEGLKLNLNDPTIAVYSDALATQEVATATTKDFGWVASNADAAAFTSTYYIKNNGTGTLTISNISEVEGFTAATAENAMTVSGENTLALTITMNKAVIGAKSGTFTLTTDGGNFTIPVKGFVYDHSKNLVDFTANGAKFPAGWTAGSWTITDGAAISASSSTIQTKKFTVAANENLYVDIKGNSGNGTKTFAYSYSTDNGANWSEANTLISESGYGIVADQVLTISDIASTTEERTVLVRITGQNLGIKHIYGFTRVDEAIMSTTAVAHDFGMQASNVDPATNAYVFTVQNDGNIDLTNLAVTLEGAEESAFAVAVAGSKTTLAAGESVDVTVTMKSSTVYGAKNDNLTIAAEGQTPVVIALSGKTRDVAKQFIDFNELDAIPAGWTAGDWTVSTPPASSDKAAYANGETTMISPAMTIAANEKLYFDARVLTAGSLTVSYTTNGGATWNEMNNLVALNSMTVQELSFGNDAEVTAFVKFTGKSAYIDNICGGVATTAPLMDIATAEVADGNGNYDFGQDLMAAPAAKVFTITNIGSDNLVATIAATGDVTAEFETTGTKNGNEVTLANGQTATITVSMAYEAENAGAKTGAVTITSAAGVATLNFIGKTIDNRTLSVDFADGLQPEGWYFGTNWSVNAYSQFASNDANSTPGDLITQQLIVDGTEDELTFKAAKTNNSYTFKVYTSQNRVEWNEVDLSALTLTESYKTVTVSGLAAGNYYLKISGAFVKVDDFLGWKKVTGIERDLYVTATTFPATTTKGNEATITATVTSLIAEEKGVYAKLFINDAEEATAAAQDISLNGTKTFSFSYAIPENKTAQIKVYYSDDDEAFATAENAMKVNYTMDENTAPASFDAGTYNVTLTYTKGAEKLGTICLPFATTTEELSTKYGTTVKIYELTSHADHVISFSGVENLDAGKPYLIYSDEALSGELTFADKAVVASPGTTDASSVTFHGIYAPTTAGNWGDEWYGVTSAGKIAKGTSATTMNGLRAYFTGDVANARIFIMDDEDVTGIAAINREGLAIDNAAVYNLNGQKVQHAKKGLYIVNGKKVVIK